MNRILLHNSDEQQDADDGDNAQVRFESIKRQDRADTSEGKVERIVIG